MRNDLLGERAGDEGMLPGDVIDDKYRIIDRIGSGGFADVYCAEQLNIGRRVALKVLKGAGRSANALRRFMGEAQMAAQVRHPNIVTIHDHGVLGAQPYIVMELLDGWDLRRELAVRGAISPQRALPLFTHCLDGLGEAHRAGIIHRDLKPSNLFLARPGARTETLQVVDFGVARRMDARSHTAHGHIYGTLNYMAPEYLRWSVAGPEGDVFQMGLILAEALSGERVVQARGKQEVARVHRERSFRVPEAILTSPLGAVIDRALAVSPGERYSDASEFAAALDAIDPLSVPEQHRSSTVQTLAWDSTAGSVAMPAAASGRRGIESCTTAAQVFPFPRAATTRLTQEHSNTTGVVHRDKHRWLLAGMIAGIVAITLGVGIGTMFRDVPLLPVQASVAVDPTAQPAAPSPALPSTATPEPTQSSAPTIPVQASAPPPQGQPRFGPVADQPQPLAQAPVIERTTVAPRRARRVAASNPKPRLVPAQPEPTRSAIPAASRPSTAAVPREGKQAAPLQPVSTKTRALP